MSGMMTKVNAAVHKLLKKDGQQSEMNGVAEYIVSAVICLNVAFIIFESVEAESKYGGIINILRWSFFAFFLVEYILRIWIADIAAGEKSHPIRARAKYILSFRGLIILLALLPTLLVGTVMDFRIFRALRLIRITQLKILRRQTDILIKVIKLKGRQLLASVLIVFIFIIISGVVICDLEYETQPDVYNNILKGIWWAVSAITTIGYGDIHPVSPIGKIFGSLISIFGIFLMAIPIGILTSGFFEVSKKIDSEPEL
ncbi:MAG: ion transporter [Oscillospiraceae bacterium]|nr:ion transporter [Oscillospiraceae bacterium]